jgi:hypothetical protein
LGLTFFGLTRKYRAALFKQIHEIVFYGNGGYDWGTVYSMPIWLRNFTFNQINNSYVEKNKDKNAEQSWVQSEAKNEAAKNKKIQVPTYVTKASKK